MRTKDRRRRSLSLSRVIAAVALGATVGCADEPLSPDQILAPTVRGKAASVSRVVDPIKDAIVSEAPQFAGMYYDRDGSLRILVTDASQEGRVVAAVRRQLGLAGRELHGRNGRIVIARATYSHAQLASWRDSVIPFLLTARGINGVGIRASANRITIDVTGEVAATGVRQAMNLLGVPPGAYAISVTPPIHRTTAYLSDYTRPLVGGLGLKKVISGSSYAPCTLGMIARWGNDNVMLVNSHCTQVDWGADPTSDHYFVQGASLLSDYRFGHEVFDSEGYGCYNFTQTCRHADVAVYSLEHLDGSPGYVRGKIARPGSRTAASSDLSDTTFSPSSPLVMTHVMDWLIEGDIVDKVGARTGWTYGEVTNDCYVAEISGGRNFQCQVLADLNMKDGDSGAPVFFYNTSNGDVHFAGIAWAEHSGVSSVFSPLGRIRMELSDRPLFLFTDYPVHEGFSTAISGPWDAVVNQPSTWTAFVAYGSGPITCDWYDGYTPIQEGSCTLTHTFTSVGTRNLNVSTWNTAGESYGANLTVGVTSGGGGGEERRVRKPPVAGKRR